LKPCTCPPAFTIAGAIAAGYFVFGMARGDDPPAQKMTLAHHAGAWILCGITAGYILWFFGGSMIDALRRKK
jgi:hypothetical protein